MWPKRIVLGLAVVFVLIQLIRPSLQNPPIDPAKTMLSTGHVTPQVEAIFDRSCNDCHSNKTVWPWYTQVAPVSWWLVDHVHEGRRELNLSEWATYPAKKQAHKLKAICDEVHKGDMPLKTYLPMHPNAKLTDADRQAVCTWSQQQLASMKVNPAAHEAEAHD